MFPNITVIFGGQHPWETFWVAASAIGTIAAAVVTLIALLNSMGNTKVARKEAVDARDELLREKKKAAQIERQAQARGMSIWSNHYARGFAEKADKEPSKSRTVSFKVRFHNTSSAPINNATFGFVANDEATYFKFAAPVIRPNEEGEFESPEYPVNEAAGGVCFIQFYDANGQLFVKDEIGKLTEMLSESRPAIFVFPRTVPPEEPQTSEHQH